jgi:DNA uptake protein ComE-like DNA-binding protein
MGFKTILTYFNFTREQRSGIVLLFASIVFFQLVYFFVDFTLTTKEYPERQKWLSLQSKIDSLNEWDAKVVSKVYLFNPNFITDYKGYKLGMSVAEIDRLLAFRKQNKYVNSIKEFQVVTMVSDSLLNAIAPYFKFPDWVANKRLVTVNYSAKAYPKKEKIVLNDLNLATQEDLVKIYGIGEVLSLRILKLKESLGGFVSMDQMKDVWGLSPEVIGSLNSHFKIVGLPNIKKININNASLKEMAGFYYFKNGLAREIVVYRSMNGDIENIEDLTKIKGFPFEKASIIGLYLDF